MTDINNFVHSDVKKGKVYFNVRVEGEPDDIAVRTIHFSKPKFIPALMYTEYDGEQQFSYDMSEGGYVSLNERAGKLTPQEFISIMKNITEAIYNCEDYLLNPCNLLLFETYIYYNPKTCDVRILYMPSYDEMNTHEEMNKQLFDMSRTLSGKPTADNWKNVILSLWEMNESTSVYEAKEFYTKLYAQYQFKGTPPITASAPPPIQQPAPVMPQQTASTPEPAKKFSLFGSKKKEPAPPAPAPAKGGIFSKKTEPEPKKSGGLFGKKEKPFEPPKVEKKSFFSKPAAKPAVVPLPVVEEPEHTEILDATLPLDGGGVNAVLYIIEHGAKTTMIPVNKNIFSVGRDPGQVDYCITDDKATSKVHIVLTHMNSGYFIMDKSSNGTFVNGQKLTPNAPEPIDHGSTISMGRKELLFELA